MPRTLYRVQNIKNRVTVVNDIKPAPVIKKVVRVMRTQYERGDFS